MSRADARNVAPVLRAQDQSEVGPDRALACGPPVWLVQELVETAHLYRRLARERRQPIRQEALLARMRSLLAQLDSGHLAPNPSNEEERAVWTRLRRARWWARAASWPNPRETPEAFRER